MSIRSTGAFAVVISKSFVESVAGEELINLQQEFDKNEWDLDFDDIARSLAEEDYGQIESDLEDYYEGFKTALDELHAKFKSETGLDLAHLYIGSDDESELDYGHHFALSFSNAYQFTPEAEKIKEHLSIEAWSVYVG